MSMQAQRGSSYQFATRHRMKVADQDDSPVGWLPRKDPVSILHESGWVSGPVWISRKTSQIPGFDPRTVQSGPRTDVGLVGTGPLFIGWLAHIPVTIPTALSELQSSICKGKGHPTTCLCRHRGEAPTNSQLGRSGRFACCLTPRKDPVSILHESEWVSGPVRISRKTSHIPGFDPRTVQSDANRYTDDAIPATSKLCLFKYSSSL